MNYDHISSEDTFVYMVNLPHCYATNLGSIPDQICQLLTILFF